MKLSWSTPLYRKVRKNFNLEFAFDISTFREELTKFSANVVRVRQSNLLHEVTDSLGMNEYHEIQFRDEKLFMMFLLRWG